MAQNRNPKPTSLQIGATEQRKLSKTQTQFNQLIAKIEQLQKEIPEEQAKYDELLKHAHERIVPLYEKIARANIATAFELEKWALKLEFKRQQRDNAGTCIVELVREASRSVDLSEEEIALHDRWSMIGFEEMEEEDDAFQKSVMETMFESMFGMKVDVDELQNNPGKIDDYQREFEERQKAADDAKREKRSGGSAKKSKASKKEELKKAAEELKAKSVRSIYISLAKLVHPDMESDPSLRAAKEEEMKKVTAAYEANDLATLLKMELEWIHKQQNQLGAIPEEKLKLYVEVLRDQVRELEREKNSFLWEPQYRLINDYAYGRKETGIRKIKKEADQLQAILDDITLTIRSFDVSNPKNRIMAFITDYLSQTHPFLF